MKITVTAFHPMKKNGFSNRDMGKIPVLDSFLSGRYFQSPGLLLLRPGKWGRVPGLNYMSRGSVIGQPVCVSRVIHEYIILGKSRFREKPGMIDFKTGDFIRI